MDHPSPKGDRFERRALDAQSWLNLAGITLRNMDHLGSARVAEALAVTVGLATRIWMTRRKRR